MVGTRFRSWSSRTRLTICASSDHEPGPDGVVYHATGDERRLTVPELTELFIRRVLGDHDRFVPNHGASIGRSALLNVQEHPGSDRELR